MATNFLAASNRAAKLSNRPGTIENGRNIPKTKPARMLEHGYCQSNHHSEKERTDNISKSQQGGTSFIIKESWHCQEHRQGITPLTVGIGGILFTPQFSSRGRTSRGGHRNHNRFSAFGEEGCNKDKENIVKEGHHQENGRDFNGIQLNNLKKEAAHTCSKDILRYPKKGRGRIVRQGKGQIQPESAPNISHGHGAGIDIGDIWNNWFLSLGLIDQPLGDSKRAKDTFDLGYQYDLNDCVSASKGIKDLDNAINLGQER